MHLLNRLTPLIFIPLFVQCLSENKMYTRLQGEVFGTYYTITYLHPQGKNLQSVIDEKFEEFNLSLSTFNPNSVISRINANDSSVVTDSYFETMYAMAQQVSIATNGAFDITVAPLVNAWGFGFRPHHHTDIPDTDTLMPYVGYRKICLQNHRLIKKERRTMLDASAIAKGLGSDVIAELLEANGCKNYMVEIGGEVACKGLNTKGEKWHIGIDKPTDDPANEEQELQLILAVSDIGLATSGNYRQFYIKEGKKYAHTINPRTGFPTENNLLSATVLAPTCMQADAYATAFMVLGVDSSLLICQQQPDMACYLIYTDQSGVLQTAYSKGFEQYIAD